jgi:hypothetical protein
MGMFDDLFTDDDFKIDDEEEETLELETHDDEDDDHEPEPDSCGPDCSCDPDCGGHPDPAADIEITDDYCDDCGCDPCECIEDDTDNDDKSVWDTGYRKPPVPKGVWKPKHWKVKK